MYYMCTKFGVNSSNRFLYGADRHTQIYTQMVTYATDHPIHALATNSTVRDNLANSCWQRHYTLHDAVNNS